MPGPQGEQREAPDPVWAYPVLHAQLQPDVLWLFDGQEAQVGTKVGFGIGASVGLGLGACVGGGTGGGATGGVTGAEVCCLLLGKYDNIIKQIA